MASDDQSEEITWRHHAGAVNLIVRFFLELALLAALATWGWRVMDATGPSFIVAVAAPFAWAALWGLLISPKARRRLGDPVRLIVELASFGLVAALLVSVELATLGIVLGGLAAANSLLMVVFRQRGA
ncbi:MAG: YrdB family protein [Nitriliruptorales bacterium]|nr:YrdB family protein [Nitriliruptorales bacterium]